MYMYIVAHCTVPYSKFYTDFIYEHVPLTFISLQLICITRLTIKWFCHNHIPSKPLAVHHCRV